LTDVSQALTASIIMVGYVASMGEIRKEYKGWFGTLKGKDYLEDLSVDGGGY
jgi:hypothetical protein